MNKQLNLVMSLAAAAILVGGCHQSDQGFAPPQDEKHLQAESASQRDGNEEWWDITTESDRAKMPADVKLAGPELRIVKGLVQSDVDSFAGEGQFIMSNLGHYYVYYTKLSIIVDYVSDWETPGRVSGVWKGKPSGTPPWKSWFRS
jgi:hypothetical protein